MKFVRTARSYRSLTVDVDGETETVDSEPRKVSNELADKLEKAGDEHGVTVLVFDADTEEGTAEAFEGVQHRAARSGVAPDLSAGIAVITGTGDPVTSRVMSDEPGDEPEQAGQAAGDAGDAGGSSADQPNTPAVSGKSGKPAKGTAPVNPEGN